MMMIEETKEREGVWERESKRRRCWWGGWRGSSFLFAVIAHPGAVLHSGIFGIFQSGFCSLGSCSRWLPLLHSDLCVRTLHVWHADMGPSLHSRIIVCLALTLAQVIAVTCQEDTKNGERYPPSYDFFCCPLIGFPCWYLIGILPVLLWAFVLLTGL